MHGVRRLFIPVAKSVVLPTTVVDTGLRRLSTLNKPLIGDTVKAQTKFFNHGKTRAIGSRLEALKSMRAAIQKHSAAMGSAIEADLGERTRTLDEMHVVGVTGSYDLAIKDLPKWMEASIKATSAYGANTYAKMEPHPKGLGLLFGSWNVPFYSTLIPLAGCLAAGNCAVIKPSDLAPHCSEVIADIVQTALPADLVTVLQGGAEVAEDLLQFQWGQIHFVGSTGVGRKVAEAAGKTLSPVVLELGGKSPVIVDKTAYLPGAVKRIVQAKWHNAGQECIAPDFVYVEESVKNQFLDLLYDELNSQFTSSPATSPNYNGRVINEKHFDRISTLISGFPIPSGVDRSKLFFPPVVLPHASLGDPIMNEEVFGPVLPVVTFDSASQLIDVLQQRPSPLALYLFSNDESMQSRVFSELKFGGGCINDTTLQAVTNPLGGVGDSGNGGSYDPEAVFKHFSYFKSMFIRPELTADSPNLPPWKKPKDSQAQWHHNQTDSGQSRFKDISSVSFKSVDELVDCVDQLGGDDMAYIQAVKDLSVGAIFQEKDYSKPDTFKKLLSLLLRMTHLESVNLSWCKIGNVGMSQICDSEAMSQITRLGLHGNRIGDEGLTCLSQTAKFQQLRKLWMWKNLVGAKGVDALVNGPGASKIELLGLYDNSVGDDGAIIISRSTEFRPHSLWLGQNNIGDKGAIAVTQWFIDQQIGKKTPEKWLDLRANPISEDVKNDILNLSRDSKIPLYI